MGTSEKNGKTSLLYLWARRIVNFARQPRAPPLRMPISVALRRLARLTCLTALAGGCYWSGPAANHAHDDWAEWAAEGGLPFLVLVAMIAI